MRKIRSIGLGMMMIWVLNASGMLAQAKPSGDERMKVVTVHQMYLEDQSDRSGDGSAKPYPASVNDRDAARRSQLRQLLANGEVKSAQDFREASFIFQHGQEADDYLLAHILAMEAVAKGDTSSRWITAATLDRYLQAIGKVQVFGTQYSDKTYNYWRDHHGDPAAMRKPEAHEVGMTQEPYNDQLIPDALRTNFCVPNREQQKKNLKVFEAGRLPDETVLPGCIR
jgi:hypothetical protein